MKTLVVISCLVLTVVARPGGYSYHAPTGGALSANLSPPLSSYSSGHSLGLAPLSSHGSLGLSSYSSGGSVALGSSYSVSPAVYAALATSGLSSPHSGSTTYYISSTGKFFGFTSTWFWIFFYHTVNMTFEKIPTSSCETSNHYFHWQMWFQSVETFIVLTQILFFAFFWIKHFE